MVIVITTTIVTTTIYQFSMSLVLPTSNDSHTEMTSPVTSSRSNDIGKLKVEDMSRLEKCNTNQQYGMTI